MSDFLKSDKGIILLLILLFCICMPFFFLHQGLMLIDTGRELYLPQQMNLGEVLYKDILNIYGPISYQFNAFLFSIFGQKINVLYYAGILNSFIIIITLYLLTREFIDKKLSFAFSVLIMFSLVFKTFLYNSNLTYSFAIIYALSSLLISVLFLVKYTKYEKPLFAYMSCLFAGVSLANKYEFCLYPIIILYVLCFLKPLGIKKFINSILCFFLVPLISIGLLFYQGLTFNDVKSTLEIFQNLVHSPTLKIYFSKLGVFFNIYAYKTLIHQNKIFSIFGLLPLLNLALFIAFFKKIYTDKPLFILILCAISASAKSFLYLNVNHMGVFIFPICILAFILLTKEYLQKYLPIILAMFILIFAADDFSSLQDKTHLISSNKGNVYTYKKDATIINQVADYIFKNTKSEDKVVILPEGNFINFITDRKTDNFYYNLCPLYYDDVFKEKEIINHFEKDLPEYFVILPVDNIEYGKRFFGIDYAQNFYEMINNKYDLKDNSNNIKIFKRKN